MEEAHDAVFDNIMRLVGDEGKFQKSFNYIFNVGLVLVASMTYMNIILTLNNPDHWCIVPGRELTNFSIDKWRDITLPRDIDARGMETYSSCKMYNITIDNIVNVFNNMNDTENNFSYNNTEMNTIDCHYGYDYNRTWYHETPVSKENWVCDRNLYVTNTFVCHRIGEVVGTFIFGQLGDTLGRRLVFFISLITVVAGRLLSIVTTSVWSLFAVVAVIDSLTSNSLFQTTLIIAMETSKSENRAHIAMLQCIGWTIGISIMPFIFWYTKEWISFLLITTLPCLTFLLFKGYMIESPRWLATKGRLTESAVQLNKIAKINGSNVKMSEKILKDMLPKVEVEAVYGMMSLFSGWRLAKNTIIIIICWVAASMSYYVLILNSSRMDGNPFLNFFWQAIVELPAYISGKILGDKIGRRYTNVLSFGLSGTVALINVFLVLDPYYESLTLALATVIKFFASVTFYVVNLQAMETYPTCLRQTGLSMGCLSANALGVLGPYIVYLGSNYDARYPFLILGIYLLVGGISALFLPETLQQKLPETLAEAKVFGADQDFWKLPKPFMKVAKDDDIEFEASEKLNQKQYSP